MTAGVTPAELSPYNSVEPVHPAVREARDLIREEAEHLQHDLNALERAIMLAPDLATCEALLRNQPVPLSKLDPLYIQRYGIRRSA